MQHSDNETIIQFKIIEKHHPQGSFFFFFSPPVNILQSISLLSFPSVILRAADDSAAKQNQNTSVFYTVSQKRQFKKCIALCLELLLTLLRPSNSIFSCQSYTEVSNASRFYELSLIPIPKVNPLNTVLMTLESMVENFCSTKM